jgi:predicted phosphoadenosine phosphosulfate sulfurtransferase
MPDKLHESGRVPSWKSIAMCILNNDLNLFGLGFQGVNSDWACVLMSEKAREGELQLSFNLWEAE